MRFPRSACAGLALMFLAATMFLAAPAEAGEWAFHSSYYTHRPDTGERVTQHTPIGPFYRQPRPDYITSGYRQTRIRTRVGADVDNTHLVEEWGRQVRPYGEWQRPYRPYSVPYDLWGAPYGGLNYNDYGHGGHGPGHSGPGHSGPGHSGPGHSTRPGGGSRPAQGGTPHSHPDHHHHF